MIYYDGHLKGISEYLGFILMFVGGIMLLYGAWVAISFTPTPVRDIKSIDTVDFKYIVVDTVKNENISFKFNEPWLKEI